MLLLLLALGLCISWLLPLHFPPWISWHMEAVAFCVVLVAAWAGWSRRKAFLDKVAIPAAAWPLGLLGLVAVLQAVAGLVLFWGDVLVLGLYLVLCFICLVLGYGAQSGASIRAPGQRPLDVLAICILAGGVLSVAIALGQCLELWPAASWVHRTEYLRRPGGNLAQPNQLALLLVMAVASTAWLYEARKFGGGAALVLFTFLGLGLAATESRSGGLAAAALLVWWFAKRGLIQSRAPLIGVAGAFAALVAMMWLWLPLYNAILMVQGNTGTRLTETGGTRLEVWAQLLAALSQHPIRGWGMLQTAVAHNSVVHAYSVSEAFSYSHNLLLDLAIWMGIPLALAVAVPALVWLWSRLRAVNALTPWYCIAICIPLAIQSMLEFPFAYAYFLVPAMFAVGALEASIGARTVQLKSWVAGLLLAGFTAVAAWSVVEYFLIEEDFRVVRFEVLRLGVRPPGYTPPEVRLFTQLGALLDAGRVELRPDMPKPELELLRTMAVRYPWSATQFRYAVALALNGDPGEAVRQLQVMRLLHGEKLYQRLKGRIQQLGETEQPKLRGLQLP